MNDPRHKPARRVQRLESSRFGEEPPTKRWQATLAAENIAASSEADADARPSHAVAVGKRAPRIAPIAPGAKPKPSARKISVVRQVSKPPTPPILRPVRLPTGAGSSAAPTERPPPSFEPPPPSWSAEKPVRSLAMPLPVDERPEPVAAVVVPLPIVTITDPPPVARAPVAPPPPVAPPSAPPSAPMAFADVEVPSFAPPPAPAVVEDVEDVEIDESVIPGLGRSRPRWKLRVLFAALLLVGEVALAQRTGAVQLPRTAGEARAMVQAAVADVQAEGARIAARRRAASPAPAAPAAPPAVITR